MGQREPETDVNLLLSEVVVILEALKAQGEMGLARRFEHIKRVLEAQWNQ